MELMHVSRSFSLLVTALTSLRLLSDADVNEIVGDAVLIDRALSMRLIDTVLPLTLSHHHTSLSIYTSISNKTTTYPQCQHLCTCLFASIVFPIFSQIQ